MAKSVFSEITEIKRILSHLVGTANLPSEQQFSKAALDKAAKLFVKMKVVEDQWITNGQLGTYFKSGYGYELGKFIREEFEFTNYYTKSSAYYYNKKDIINLAEELKSRNVDLGKYMQLCQSKEHLAKKLLEIASKNRDARVKAKGKTKAYKLSDDLKNIQFSDYGLPEMSLVEQDIKKLMLQFNESNFKKYIDFYRDIAMVTYDSSIRDYLPNKTYSACQSWCNKYNKAKHAFNYIKEHQDKETM